MKLFEINTTQGLTPAEMKAIEAIRTAKSQLALVRSKGSPVHQGAIDPALKPQYDRAMFSLKAAEQSLRIAQDAKAHADDKPVDAILAAKKAQETEEERHARHAQSIGHGIHDMHVLRNQYGGWEGLADAVHKYVVTASNSGANRVTADDIAHSFPGTTVRTVNKWLERPEFLKTARLLGRR
jgi:hypothetical protein